MEYVNLGKTGLKVSKICLGCMGFGELDRGGIPGKTAEKEAREIIKYALEHGINFLTQLIIIVLVRAKKFLDKH